MNLIFCMCLDIHNYMPIIQSIQSIHMHVAIQSIHMHVVMWSFSPFICMWSGKHRHPKRRFQYQIYYMSRVNWPIMLIFCVWIGIYRNRFSYFKQLNSLVLEFLNSGPKIPSANQIDRFFYIKYHQNGLIFWLHFFTQQCSIMIETNWINFGHWWVLGFFTDGPWSQACSST